MSRVEAAAEALGARALIWIHDQLVYFKTRGVTCSVSFAVVEDFETESRWEVRRASDERVLAAIWIEVKSGEAHLVGETYASDFKA